MTAPNWVAAFLIMAVGGLAVLLMGLWWLSDGDEPTISRPPDESWIGVVDWDGDDEEPETEVQP